MTAYWFTSWLAGGNANTMTDTTETAARQRELRLRTQGFNHVVIWGADVDESSPTKGES